MGLVLSLLAVARTVGKRSGKNRARIQSMMNRRFTLGAAA